MKYGQSFFIYLMKIDIVWYLIWSLDYLFKCQSWNWNCFIRSAICFQCIKRTYFWQVLAVAFCCILANKKNHFSEKGDCSQMRVLAVWNLWHGTYAGTIPIIRQQIFEFFLTHPPYVSINSTKNQQNLQFFWPHPRFAVVI